MLTRFQTECPALYSSTLAEAKRLQHGHVGVEHVALALLSDAASPLAAAFKQIGLDAATADATPLRCKVVLERMILRLHGAGG